MAGQLLSGSAPNLHQVSQQHPYLPGINEFEGMGLGVEGNGQLPREEGMQLDMEGNGHLPMEGMQLGVEDNSHLPAPLLGLTEEQLKVG